MIPESTPVYTNRLQCVECGLVSGENESGWTAHLTDDEPEEVVVFSLRRAQSFALGAHERLAFREPACALSLNSSGPLLP